MTALFSEATVAFLARAPLEEKACFEANRPAYLRDVLGPQKALVQALAPHMEAIDPQLVGACSRIYRDMRFSKGPLLRGNVWICFHDSGMAPDERPEFFVEVFADCWRCGMGFYSTTKAKMDAVRAAIDANPDRFAEVVGGLPPAMQLLGETYKKSRAGHLPEQLRPWYDKKSLWVQEERPLEALLFSEGLVDYVWQQLAGCAGLYRFLRDARPPVLK